MLKSITDNLAQITQYGTVNCYLVRDESGGFSVIDTAVPGSYSAILLAAKELGGRINRVMLTHSHSDHIGSLAALRRSLPRTEFLVSRRELRLLHGDLTLDPTEAQTPLKPSFYTTMLDLNIDTFEYGDTVGDLEVIASPGHTPGHVSFFDRRDGSLIAGDAFQVLGGFAVSGVVRPRFPLPAMASWDSHTSLISAIRLRDLRPTRIAAGHGSVLENPADELESAISEARYKFNVPREPKAVSIPDQTPEYAEAH